MGCQERGGNSSSIGLDAVAVKLAVVQTYGHSSQIQKQNPTHSAAAVSSSFFSVTSQHFFLVQGETYLSGAFIVHAQRPTNYTWVCFQAVGRTEHPGTLHCKAQGGAASRNDRSRSTWVRKRPGTITPHKKLETYLLSAKTSSTLLTHSTEQNSNHHVLSTTAHDARVLRAR